MKSNLKITILLDKKSSFLNDYTLQLFEELKKRGYFSASLIKDAKEIKKGDLLFLLGCKAILSKEQLKLNTHNLVIHPSKLPEGKGGGALVIKILEGKNEVYITLFEAVEKVDTGNYYFQEPIQFRGHELSDELRHKQAMKVFELIFKFLDEYPNITPKKQVGKSSFYPERFPESSELDINKTIKDQFNLFRVVDNKRYPAFFYHKGYKYILHIFKEDKIKNINKNEKIRK